MSQSRIFKLISARLEHLLHPGDREEPARRCTLRAAGERAASQDISLAVVIEEYERALAALQGAGARLPELAGTMNLARCLCESNAFDDARTRLDRSLSWSTEGHDTPSSNLRGRYWRTYEAGRE